jgi:hypothetical protein
MSSSFGSKFPVFKVLKGNFQTFSIKSIRNDIFGSFDKINKMAYKIKNNNGQHTKNN